MLIYLDVLSDIEIVVRIKHLKKKIEMVFRYFVMQEHLVIVQ